MNSGNCKHQTVACYLIWIPLERQRRWEENIKMDPKMRTLIGFNWLDIVPTSRVRDRGLLGHLDDF
jgi:hypothetical protein